MPVAFAISYERGRARPLADRLAPDIPEHAFVWIDLTNPTRAELQELAKPYNLHHLAIDDALTDQLPKAEPVGADLFVTTRTARQGEREIQFGQIAIFIGEQSVISACRDDAPDRAGLRASLESVPEMFDLGVDYILHGLLGFAADSFIDLVDGFDQEVSALEAAIPEGALDAARIGRLLMLRQHVKRLERTLKPMEETGRKLATGELPRIRPDLTVYFRDVVDRVQRAQSVCASIRDSLASVFEYSSLIEQQRAGQVTRQLAAWAAILAVPTGVAGIYGMNFQHMPELGLRYGYLACLAFMAALSFWLFRRFRRLGWL